MRHEPGGRLYILSGPSGSGKDTILSKLRSRHPELQFSISCVTRPPRAGESGAEQGGKYHFVAKEHFLEMLGQGGFLEYNEYLGNYYGTPRRPVEEWFAKGQDVILEIDVNGAQKVREECPGAISLFIIPPSFDALKKRLLGRSTEDGETAMRRLSEAVSEIRRACEYDFVIVNDDLDTAVADISAILRANRLRSPMMANKIQEVLKDAESFHW